MTPGEFTDSLPPEMFADLGALADVLAELDLFLPGMSYQETAKVIIERLGR